MLLRPDTLTAIPAFTPCTYVCPRRMDQVYVHFTAAVFGALEPFASLGWPYQVPVRDARGTQQIMDRMVAADRAGSPAAALTNEGLLRLLLAEFASAPVARPARLAGAKLQEVAETVGFRDAFYFSRVFTRLTGLPPSRYRQATPADWQPAARGGTRENRGVGKHT